MRARKILIANLGSSFILAMSSLAGGSVALAKGGHEHISDSNHGAQNSHSQMQRSQTPQTQTWTSQDTQSTSTNSNSTRHDFDQSNSQGEGEDNGGSGNDNEHNKVTLCHATGSQTNPFVEITVDANGAIHGHAGHADDIIPPFDYNDHGTTEHFAGLNWDANGQAIFNNGCKPVGGQGGGGGQKDCDNDFDNSSADEHSCQQKDCDNDFDNSSTDEQSCQMGMVTPPTGGRGGVTTTVTTAAQPLASTTVAVGGAGAVAAASGTPTELPNTGLKSGSSIWSTLAVIFLGACSFYWREMIVPFLRRR